MRKLNVTLAGKDWDTARMFQRHGAFNVVTGTEGADLICFLGGADVSPSLYGEVKHPATMVQEAADVRDKYYWDRGISNGIPMVGICRGGQFLNVMSGGKMYQHVDKHTQEHFVMYSEGAVVIPYKVTSTHHQMMLPQGEFELWGRVRRSTFRDRDKALMNAVTDKDPPDSEIVFYPKTKCLCFQPHPEYGQMSTHDLFFICLNRFFKAINFDLGKPLGLSAPRSPEATETLSRMVH
jgi:hypothetical protein